MSIIRQRRSDQEIENQLEEILYHVGEAFNVDVPLDTLSQLVATSLHEDVETYIDNRIKDWHPIDKAGLIAAIHKMKTSADAAKTAESAQTADTTIKEVVKRKRGRPPKALN